MSIANKFRKSTGNAGGERTAPARKSRYAGVKASVPRTGMPAPGVYRFRVLSCEEGHNPGKGTDSFKADLEIVGIAEGGDGHAIGDVVTFVQLLSGRAGPAGLGRTKALVLAAAGYDDEAAFDDFAGEGEFIDAVVGHRNRYSEAGLTIVGRTVDCEVTRGRDIVNPTTQAPTGDYYREFAWAPDGELGVVSFDD